MPKMIGTARAFVIVAGLVLAVAGCTPPREEAVRVAGVEGWPEVPEGAVFGQVSAVDVDSHGHVFVLQRGNREWSEPFPAAPIAQPAVWMFDGATGKLLARWGARTFVMPHGLSVDPQDHVWITDAGREQVLAFSHDGTLELTLGTRGKSGDDAHHFGRPTDVAFDGGRVLVSDGYLNGRIAVFDRDGHFQGQWGSKGSELGQFAIPHSISVAGGRVVVADRENGRIQIFDAAGALQAVWSSPVGGRVYSAKLLPDGRVVSVEGRDRADRAGAIVRIYRTDGSVERTFDAGRVDGGSRGHDIALAPGGWLYLADVDGGRVAKIKLGESDRR